MKICPICDQKVEGTWCRQCHRFVNPWIIKEDIYINERHPAKDDFCDFHNPHYDAKGTHQAMQQSTVRYKSVSHNTEKNSDKQGKSSGKKRSPAAIIALIYFAIVIIYSIGSAFGPIGDFIEDFFDNLGDYIDEQYDNHHNYDYDDYDNYYYDNYSDNSVYRYGDDIIYYEDSNPNHQFLNDLNAEYSKEDEYGLIYYYYNAEDIKNAGQECDGSHFELTYSELRTMINDLYGSSNTEFYDYTDCEFNYRVFYMDEEADQWYPSTYFETYYYTDIDGITLYISADTGTQGVHFYELVGYDYSEDTLEKMYSWFDAYYEDLFDSYEDFENYICRLGDDESYSYIDLDDELGYIGFYCDESGVDIQMVPY